MEPPSGTISNCSSTVAWDYLNHHVSANVLMGSTMHTAEESEEKKISSKEQASVSPKLEMHVKMALQPSAVAGIDAAQTAQTRIFFASQSAITLGCNAGVRSTCQAPLHSSENSAKKVGSKRKKAELPEPRRQWLQQVRPHRRLVPQAQGQVTVAATARGAPLPLWLRTKQPFRVSFFLTFRR
jgi:hypothetical protein